MHCSSWSRSSTNLVQDVVDSFPWVVAELGQWDDACKLDAADFF
jgi:hypothetical protein